MDLKSFAKTYWSMQEKKLDPVGKEDGDVDNDGDKDSSDSYLMKRRAAIKKAMKKEEVEQIDELSKKTMGSYIAKGAKDLADRRVKLGVIISSISEKNNIIVEDSDLTKSVVEEAKKYPGQEQKVVQFYKDNPSMMNNLRGIALEEKVMSFVVNSCKKTEKKCTMDELFKSDFLKEEKSQISSKKKEVK